MVNDTFVKENKDIDDGIAIYINVVEDDNWDDLHGVDVFVLILHYDLTDLKNVGNLIFTLSTLINDPNVTVIVYSVLTLISLLY